MSSRRESSDWRLRKHAEYQRVYQDSRKHFSGQISYFFAKAILPVDAYGVSRQLGARIGLTVPKALGKAVDRNRIKRRLRELIRNNHDLITSSTDVILHPKRFVLKMDFGLLEREVVSVFKAIQRQTDPVLGRPARKEPRRREGRPEISGALR